MAIVNKVASDLSGTLGEESEFAKLVVRQHPKLQEPKRLDVLPDEVSGLKDVSDLVMLEVTLPDGTTRDMAVRLAEFNKLAPNGNMEEILAAAPGTKGRRANWSPSSR